MYLNLFEAAVLTGWICVVVYSFVLSLIGRIRGRNRAPLIFPRHVFALVIPVGNDENFISRTLDHLRRTKYPRNQFDIIVAPVNSTDETATIARRKEAIVYGPKKDQRRDTDEAILDVLERLSSKDRYDAYILLDVRSRISTNYLRVMSDKLSKGALAVQSGYAVSGRKWTWNTACRAMLSTLNPGWLTSWSLKYRLASGIHRTGLCISRRLVEKHGVRKPALDNVNAFLTKLLRRDVVIQYAENAWVYDRSTTIPRISANSIPITSRWNRARNDGLPLISEGLKWRSTAQVIGGVNLFMPTFGTMLATSLAFYVLAVYLHGVASLIAIGWLALITSLGLFVIFRLWLMRAPLLAYAAVPSLPLLLFWQSAKSFWAPTPTSEPIIAKTAPKNEQSKSGRPRRRYSRRPKRQSS